MSSVFDARLLVIRLEDLLISAGVSGDSSNLGTAPRVRGGVIAIAAAFVTWGESTSKAATSWVKEATWDDMSNFPADLLVLAIFDADIRVKLRGALEGALSGEGGAGTATGVDMIVLRADLGVFAAAFGVDALLGLFFGLFLALLTPLLGDLGDLGAEVRGLFLIEVLVEAATGLFAGVTVNLPGVLLAEPIVFGVLARTGVVFLSVAFLALLGLFGIILCLRCIVLGLFAARTVDALAEVKDAIVEATMSA